MRKFDAREHDGLYESMLADGTLWPSAFIILVLVLIIGALNYAYVAKQKEKESMVAIAGTVEIPGTVKRVTWEGHSYILYDGNYAGSLTHDPDCKCGKGDR